MPIMAAINVRPGGTAMTGLPLTFLRISCLATIGIGLVSALASHPIASGPWALLMDLLQWPVDGAQSVASPEARVLSAVLGGIACGWGLLLYLLASGPIARGDREARGMFVASVLTWFAIDSLASLAAGWPANLLLNTAFAAMLLVPFVLGVPRSAGAAGMDAA
jgi:hypothetical protein